MGTTATLNVKKSNQYSKYNGQQFQIKDEIIVKGKKVYGLIGVNPDFPANTIDFTQDEVLLN